jgi:choline dehydrogenase-like flavoprotein
MIQSGAVEYRPGRLVLRYREANEGVEVVSKNLETGLEETVWARKLALGAGAFNTARIVLASNQDYETRLPILDNPMAFVPFFRLGRIGAPEDRSGTSLAQLNLILEDKDWGEPLQGSFYGASGPLRSDVLFSLPFPVRAAMTWTKYLVPATGSAILFYPAVESAGNYLRLRPSGELEVKFDPLPPQPAETRLLRLLRTLGCVCSRGLIQRPPMGAGLHYAGALPMRTNPTRYQTDSDGRLAETRNVYVVDGACISRLPAKNLTFTIMANALRIGRKLAAEVA